MQRHVSDLNLLIISLGKTTNYSFDFIPQIESETKLLLLNCILNAELSSIEGHAGVIDIHHQSLVLWQMVIFIF